MTNSTFPAIAKPAPAKATPSPLTATLPRSPRSVAVPSNLPALKLASAPLGRSLLFSGIQLGTNGDDSLTGTALADILIGLGGKDILSGKGGNDRLYGGAGDDRLFGGSGNDRLYGGTGSDRLFGGAGNDRLFGGTGSDRLFGNNGNDRLYGGAGNDRLFGGPGNDRLRGGRGSNQLDGGAGVDRAEYLSQSGPVVLRYDIDLVTSPGIVLPTGTRVELQLQHSTGVDVLDNIEQITAPAGQNNQIDFSDFYIQPFRSPLPPTRISPPIQADLAAETLSYDQTQIQIQNFRSVTGSYQDDVIRGDAQDNELSGFFGEDVLDGREGDDLLIGNGDDTLTGGNGADTFRLEASSALFAGRNGFGVYGKGNELTDFVSGVDRLELVQQNDTRIASTTVASQIDFNGFEALSLGTLSSSEFFTVNDASEINAQVSGVYYIPSSGELYYRAPNIYPPAMSQPFATVQGGGITASDIVVV